MISKKNKKLLIIAGATVSVNDKGEFVTKNPMADYLHKIQESFESCTWVANRYLGDDYGGVLNSTNICVIVVDRGWCGRVISWIKMIKLSLQHNYVIYYLPNPYLPILPLIRACACRLVVYLAGDYEVNIQWYQSQRWPGWATLFRWSFELPMRLADVVVARGRRLARMASRFNPNVYETVPLGHINFGVGNFVRLKNVDERCDGRILFIGKIVHSKGVGDLINAFKLLSTRHPKMYFSLDLVGDGDDRAGYETSLQAGEIMRRVRFHGWVSSSEQIDMFFSQADLLVVPSIYPEGVPRVIDEAIVRGVPVVATPVGGIGEEFCNEEILMVRESAPEELCLAMERMLFDLNLRAHHLARAAGRSEFFRSHGSAAKQHAAILLSDA